MCKLAIRKSDRKRERKKKLLPYNVYRQFSFVQVVLPCALREKHFLVRTPDLLLVDIELVTVLHFEL